MLEASPLFGPLSSDFLRASVPVMTCHILCCRDALPVKVAVIGGGPAGAVLFAAAQAGAARRGHHRPRAQPARTTRSAGASCSPTRRSRTFARPIRPSFEHITASFAHWDDIDVHVRGRVITSSGHGFAGIARKKLLNILQARCAELGVPVRFETDRQERRGSGAARPRRRRRHCRGRRHQQRRPGPACGSLSSRICDVGQGPVHLARHDVSVRRLHVLLRRERARRLSGALLSLRRAHLHVHRRMRRGVVAGCGLRHGSTSTARSPRARRLFAPWLKGHRLMTNARHMAAPWAHVRARPQRDLVSPATSCSSATRRTPRTSRLDPAPSSRWRMRLRSRACWRRAGPLPDAFATYQDERMTEALRLQNAARNSTEWFEHVKRYIRMEPEQFTYSLLTRSQRVSHENLRLRDATYLAGVERWFAARSGSDTRRGAADVHAVHAARHDGRQSRRRGAHGHVFGRRRDARRVSPGASRHARDWRRRPGDDRDDVRGRRRPHHARRARACTTPEHVPAWRRIVDFVHDESRAKICLQLGHAGRQGIDEGAVAWRGRAAGRRQLAAHGAVGGAVRAAVAGAPRR